MVFEKTFPVMPKALHRMTPARRGCNSDVSVGVIGELVSRFTRMTFPHLTPGQFAVAQADVDTGIVLTTDGRRHLGTGEVYRVFDSLEAARAFAQQIVRGSPRVECGIYDAQQTHIQRVTTES